MYRIESVLKALHNLRQQGDRSVRAARLLGITSEEACRDDIDDPPQPVRDAVKIAAKHAALCRVVFLVSEDQKSLAAARRRRSVLSGGVDAAAAFLEELIAEMWSETVTASAKPWANGVGASTRRERGDGTDGGGRNSSFDGTVGDASDREGPDPHEVVGRTRGGRAKGPLEDPAPPGSPDSRAARAEGDSDLRSGGTDSGGENGGSLASLGGGSIADGACSGDEAGGSALEPGGGQKGGGATNGSSGGDHRENHASHHHGSHHHHSHHSGHHSGHHGARHEGHFTPGSHGDHAVSPGRRGSHGARHSTQAVALGGEHEKGTAAAVMQGTRHEPPEKIPRDHFYPNDNHNQRGGRAPRLSGDAGGSVGGGAPSGGSQGGSQGGGGAGGGISSAPRRATPANSVEGLEARAPAGVSISQPSFSGVSDEGGGGSTMGELAETSTPELGVTSSGEAEYPDHHRHARTVQRHSPTAQQRHYSFGAGDFPATSQPGGSFSGIVSGVAGGGASSGGYGGTVSSHRGLRGLGGGGGYRGGHGSHSSSARRHKSVRFATTIDDGGQRTGSRGRYSPPPSPPRSVGRGVGREAREDTPPGSAARGAREDTPPVPPDPTGGDPNGGHHPSDPLGALPVVGAVLDGAQEGPAISPGGDKPRSSGDKDEVVATVLGKRDAPDGDGDE